jgi:protein translocase SEC61 complex gamma subunit
VEKMSLDNSRIGTASFYKRAIRILKLAKRPDRSEVFLVIKITVAGMAILGLIAYVIRFILAAILPGKVT